MVYMLLAVSGVVSWFVRRESQELVPPSKGPRPAQLSDSRTAERYTVLSEGKQKCK